MSWPSDQLTRPVVGGCARLRLRGMEADRRNSRALGRTAASLGRPCDLPRPPRALEYLLGDIEPDDANMHFGRLLP